MAQAVSRCVILSKSDKMGKNKKDEEKTIKYFCLLSFDPIDLNSIAKDMDGATWWTTKDIDVKVGDQYFAITEVMKDSLRIVDVMTKEEYIASLGL